MPVPLEDYTVREAGILRYDTLAAVASKYGTTPAALKYFNRNSPHSAEINNLNTGEGLFTFASKIDPAKIPVLKVPEIPTGNSTTNTTSGSVSSNTYSSFISLRIILKRINAKHGTAILNNLPLIGGSKQPIEYFLSAEVQNYYQWTPLYNIVYEYNNYLAANPTLPNDQHGRVLYAVLDAYIKAFAKVLRNIEDESARITYFGIQNTNNPTQTPPDSDKDKKKVLEIIIKLVDLANDGDSYGHWWLEIYNGNITLPPSTQDDPALYNAIAPHNVKASYGFWPLDSAGITSGAIFGSGVRGGINRKDPFDITQASHNFDPYANPDFEYVSWKVDKAFFVTDPYGRTENIIEDDIIEYISSFPADMKWAWPDTSEEHQHCQTFQKELLAACGLVAAPEIPKSQFPPLDKYSRFWGVETLP